MVSGYLSQKQLVGYVAASDIVALPFILVPSDAPLSLLEAHALGKPVVTTNVACLPELAGQGIGYLAQPANPVSLADALAQAAETLPTQRDKMQMPKPPIRRWQEVGHEWEHFIQQWSMAGI
jgi:glycosyltransferase involved in cell wall biosynthesis